MSRVVRFSETGGPEVLRIETIEVPAPGQGEVRIAVKAIGLNRAESMFRSGQYVEDPQLPAGLGYEAAGVVDSVGPGVVGFAAGDAVSVVPAFSLNAYGMYGELVLAPARAVVKHPPTLSFEQAAATWMMYITAYSALIEDAKLAAGEVVLIPAASSSVGIAAIQLATMVGAVPVALTRTGAKRAKLLELGAAHVVATAEQDLLAEVRRITNGAGARIAFDPVGGPTLAKLTAALAPGGILFLYGALSTEPTPLPVFDVLGKCLTVKGHMLMATTQDPGRLREAVRFIGEGLARGALKPVIAKTFPFAQIVEAHRYLETNQQIGKIVVTL